MPTPTTALTSQARPPSGGKGGVICCSRFCSTAVPAVRKACALYKECATMCSSASSYRPRPHCISMKPICAQVDQASDTLMLTRVIIVAAATTAVMPPTTTSSACASGTSATSVPRRIIT